MLCVLFDIQAFLCPPSYHKIKMEEGKTCAKIFQPRLRQSQRRRRFIHILRGKSHNVFYPSNLIFWIEMGCTVIRGPSAPSFEIPCAPSFEVPGKKILDQNCQVLGVYRPLRPKRAIPHPITIQNMRFER